MIQAKKIRMRKLESKITQSQFAGRTNAVVSSLILYLYIYCRNMNAPNRNQNYEKWILTEICKILYNTEFLPTITIINFISTTVDQKWSKYHLYLIKSDKIAIQINRWMTYMVIILYILNLFVHFSSIVRARCFSH